MVVRIAADQGNGMKWRVMVELIGSDGTVRSHEVSAGGTNAAECSAVTVGLTLVDGKRTLAGLQDHLITGRNGRSRTPAHGDCCPCSGRWGFGHHVSCPAGAR
jgi:hypothetical protein